MPLEAWDTFYVIVGGSAGALIGLQFVVMTLIADRPPPRAPEAGAVFSTPTVVHFAAALLLAAVLRVPWPTLSAAAAAAGVVGAAGFIYGALIAKRMRTQTAYAPDFEDWCCHALLPLLAYATLMIAAFTVRPYPYETPFAIGGAVLLLLFVGIHNAWDSVAFLVYASLRNREPR